MYLVQKWAGLHIIPSCFHIIESIENYHNAEISYLKVLAH